MRRRRVTRAVVALVGAVAILTGPAAEARVTATTFVLVRTTSGPSWYDLTISVQVYPDDGGFVGLAYGRSLRGRMDSVSAGVIASAEKSPEAGLGAGGQQFSACKASNGQVLCWPSTVPGILGLAADYRSDGSSMGDHNLAFFAASGRTVSVKFKGMGWKFVRTKMAFRAVEGFTTSPAWARVTFSGAEVFTNARASGGKNGSVAVAMPPCSPAAISVTRGVGSVSLAGGVTNPSATCPSTQAVILSSYATKATTWDFSGVAVGEVTLNESRLFVLDLPKKLPATAP